MQAGIGIRARFAVLLFQTTPIIPTITLVMKLATFVGIQGSSRTNSIVSGHKTLPVIGTNARFVEMLLKMQEIIFIQMHVILPVIPADTKDM